MKTILKWTDNNGSYFLNENDTGHPIRDISENDVLAIMRVILDETDEIHMDQAPDESEYLDQAALVIYKELHEQFSKMITERNAIKARIDSQFAEAMSYYGDENPIDNLFENISESVADNL